MNRRKALAAIGCLFLFTFLTSATPVHLNITPIGKTQIAVTISPVAPYPDSIYEVLARTNSREGRWINVYSCVGNPSRTVSATIDLGKIRGLTVNNLQNWTFVAGYGGDTDGNTLPDIYEDLVSRTDPFNGADPYASPMNDGWTYIEKMQRGMDPYRPYPPPPPQVLGTTIRGNSPPGETNSTSWRQGTATITWTQQGHVEYFIVERANRMFRPITNSGRPFPPGTRPTATISTNKPPPRSIPPRPYPPRQDPFVIGPFEVVAKIPEQPGVHEYHYSETNVDTLLQPLYRVRCHYPDSPLHTRLDEINAATIRHSLIPIISRPSTNGYDLTVEHPIEYAYYLLLVRDQNNPQWRASGYFTSGTNRGPVFLRTDAKGMMSSEQKPLAMPAVKFVPDVVHPEFVAGWGEDSDEDGLPDIYEVMVTKTAPDITDTGNTGIVDGYKDLAGDGWSNLEKFRRRLDPFRRVDPPPTVELDKPNLIEIMRANTLQTDLHFEPHIEVRTNGGFRFQSITNFPPNFFLKSSRDPRNARMDFDVRISWTLPEPHPRESSW